MTRRRRALIVVCGLLIATAAGLVARNQIKVRRGRLARAAAMQARHPQVDVPADVRQFRQSLFDMLQPVALSNCTLERFGEAHDGGYLMCANLLGAVQAAYSYGINGYDDWGCDVSIRFAVPVHQYDCFNLDRPRCWRGKAIFHPECVGPRTETLDGRPFDSVPQQLVKNGDAGKRIVLKIDVEGAEWDTLLSMPDDVLRQLDQLVVEFHWEEGGRYGWAQDDRYPRVVTKLRQLFEVAHIHYNNASCVGDLDPFPSHAFEVLFVSRRLAVVDPARRHAGLHPEDAKNNRTLPDCQAAS